MPVLWVWDAAKDVANQRKHGLSLAAGALALDGDPSQLSVANEHEDGDHWRTLGYAGPVLLFVVHTDPVPDDDSQLTGRIISVRKATRNEGAAYAADR